MCYSTTSEHLRNRHHFSTIGAIVIIILVLLFFTWSSYSIPLFKYIIIIIFKFLIIFVLFHTMTFPLVVFSLLLISLMVFIIPIIKVNIPYWTIKYTLIVATWARNYSSSIRLNVVGWSRKYSFQTLPMIDLCILTDLCHFSLMMKICSFFHLVIYQC